MKRLTLLLVPLLPLIVTGCADFSFNSNLDKESIDSYFKPSRVQVYEQAELASRNYLYLGTVEGSACQTDAMQPAPKAGDARTEARRQVADMGGNGVIFSQCAEFNDTPTCVSQLVCYGQALNVATE
jgi:RcsF protein